MQPAQAKPVSVDHLGGQDGHGFGAHPPRIALAAHGRPDPVEMSDLPHPASRIHVMSSPAMSLYQWRGVW